MCNVSVLQRREKRSLTSIGGADKENVRKITEK